MHCYYKVRLRIYNTDSKSSGYYSTVGSTFKSSVTTKTQPTYELINQFWKQEAQLLPRDHAMRNVNSNLNANGNSNPNPNPNDPNPNKRNLIWMS